jgi:hypothetical protein
VRQEAFAVRLRAYSEPFEARVREAEQAKALLDAAVRPCRHQVQTFASIPHDRTREFMPLSLGATAVAAGTCRRVRFVHDHQIGQMVQEAVPLLLVLTKSMLATKQRRHS